MPNGNVKLYSPTGAALYLAVSGTFRDIEDQIGLYIQTGWLVEQPPRQRNSVIGWIVRRSKLEEDGSETPLIDLYVDHPDMVYRILSKYLNKPEEVAEFEALVGAQISALPYSDSNAPLKRGDAKSDKYFYRLPHPVRVFYRDNPDYNPDETDTKKKKPQYLFTRWGEKVQGQTSSQTQSTNGKNSASEAPKSGQSSDSHGDAPFLSARRFDIVSVGFGELGGERFMDAFCSDKKTVIRLGTTKPFADAGFSVSYWLDEAGKNADNRFVLQEPIGLTAHQEADKRWVIDSFVAANDIPW